MNSRVIFTALFFLCIGNMHIALAQSQPLDGASNSDKVIIKNSIQDAIKADKSFAKIFVGSDGADDGYKKLFIGVPGSASQDNRVDEFDLRTPLGPGPRTGCHGDTFESGVTIIGAEIQKTGSTPNGKHNIYAISLSYAGNYQRRGYSHGCVHTASENISVHGRYTFTLTERKNAPPTISNGSFSQLGDAPEGHDSNNFAERALSNALSKVDFSGADD